MIFSDRLKIANIFVAAFFGFSFSNVQAQLTTQGELGKLLYFDENLSEPAGQSCASCHLPTAGWADPDTNLPVSEGVIPGRFGGRNSPVSAYAVFFPEFSFTNNIAIGGQFWDGRATNLTEQAKGPFLTPVEMNNPDRETVLADIQASSYSNLFEQVCGPVVDVDTSYHCMAEAIAAFESSEELNQFTSKFDAVQAGLASFTRSERRGQKLFNARHYAVNATQVAGTMVAAHQVPVLFYLRISVIIT